MSNEFKRDGSHLAYCPPVEKWNDWTELDPESWPRRVEKHYDLVPTICFNCESACGMLAYVNKETGKIDKFSADKLIGFAAKLGIRFYPSVVKASRGKPMTVKCDVTMAAA